MFACIYLDNSDHDKCKSIIQSLSSKKSLGKDQYPIMTVEIKNIQSNHKFDKNKNKKQYHKYSKANKNKGNKEVKETTPLLFGAKGRKVILLR